MSWCKDINISFRISDDSDIVNWCVRKIDFEFEDKKLDELDPYETIETEARIKYYSNTIDIVKGFQQLNSVSSDNLIFIRDQILEDISSIKEEAVTESEDRRLIILCCILQEELDRREN